MISYNQFQWLTTIDNIIVAGSFSNKGLLYSKDNGKTWKESNIKIGDFWCLTVVGNTVITYNLCNELYYSKNKGKTWHKSNIIE